MLKINLCWFNIISAVPIHNLPVRNWPIVWPVVLLLAAVSRTSHPNNFTLDNVVPLVLSNTLAKCEVDWKNGCRDNWRFGQFYSLLLWLQFISHFIQWKPCISNFVDFESYLAYYFLKLEYYKNALSQSWAHEKFTVWRHMVFTGQLRFVHFTYM